MSRKKKTEYREIKPYWTNKLNKKYDEIHFRNGYQPNSPFMKIEFKGINYGIFEGKRCYAIKLGKILEVKNISPELDKQK